MKYFLSIVAIFKNEGHILKEWIDHYLKEGVDHFYLIDNGSQDNYQSTLRPYLEKKVVEIVIDPEKYKQTEHYNNYFLTKVKRECRWVMIVDLDEFVYSRQKFKTISDYLRSDLIDQSIGQIYIPWKEFGSSGQIQQPKTCINHFVWRKKYINQRESHTKTIFRPQLVKQMWIHHSFLNSNAKEITTDGQAKNNQTPYFANISEQILKQSCLHCNHYYAQSFEWYRKIKIPRGSASGAVNDSAKSIERYNLWNETGNQMIDPELSQKNKLSIPRSLCLSADRLSVYYGFGNTYVDVTQKAFKFFYQPSRKCLVIDQNIILNQYFGDPIYGVEKFLIFKIGQKLFVSTEWKRQNVIQMMNY